MRRDYNLKYRIDFINNTWVELDLDMGDLQNLYDPSNSYKIHSLYKDGYCYIINVDHMIRVVPVVANVIDGKRTLNSASAPEMGAVVKPLPPRDYKEREEREKNRQTDDILGIPR